MSHKYPEKPKDSESRPWQVLVAGSREWKDTDKLTKVLDDVLPTHCRILHGGARGVDSMAGTYAHFANIFCEVFKPEYELYSAVPWIAPLQRNVVMVKKADMVIVFWDGRSKGTHHTIGQAKKQVKPLMIVREDGTVETYNWADIARPKESA